jgi:hypothetical protein
MWLADIRDIAIVLLAIESVVIGVLLALTLLQVRKLIRLLREEIAPMLNAANETLSTVQGTTNIVSQTVVNPLIKASSYTAGVTQTLRSLFFIGRKIKSQDATNENAHASSGNQQ